ncbi:MAG: hypothetical protein IJ375_00895 [Oscillospiraceae bacterium]|nr:hypothetical protein [Oscillospiraceae bacterium]
MRNTKRIISMLLVVCMLLSVLPMSAFALDITSKPANGTTVGQPFLAGTGGSTNFRIPGIVTLNNGTLIATTDARWSGTADAGGIDTLVSVSTDNGANWTYTFANYLGDNGDTWINTSSCFIDPAIGTDGTTAYMIADLYPAGFAINSAAYYAQDGSTGFDDAGHLLLRSDEENGITFGDSGYASSAASATYGYYLADGKIYTTEGAEVEGYSVDAYFNLTGTDADGNEVSTNLFFSDSPYKPFPTDYLYMTTSTDGLNWSEPELLNLKEADEQSYLIGPGNGTYNAVTGHMVFTAYEYDWGTQNTSLVWRDTDGQWYRSGNMSSTWTSEASAVVLDDGTVRVFYRDGYSVLRYTDMVWDEDSHNYVADPDATEVTTSAAKRSNCQLSAVMYTEQIDGKDAILVSCPANSGARADGHLYVFLVNEDKSVELAYDYDIIPDSTEGYAYSCISVMNDGNVALLYEGDNASTSASAEIIFTTIDMDEVMGRENDARLTWVDADLWLGESVTYTDYTGDYSAADVSGLDTAVATVDVTANSLTATVGSRMSDSATVVLDNCLYTFTSTGTDYTYYISTTLTDGTTVYVEPYATTVGNGCPNVEGDADTLAVQVLAGLSGNQVKLYGNGGGLHFHSELETPYWNRCGNDTSGGCNVLLLYRPIEDGEESSTEIPGYIQISRDDIVSGGQYLIAAQNTAGNTYVLNPVSSTNSADHMAKVTGEQTISTSDITFTAVAVGETEVQIGTTVYTVTVSEKPAEELTVEVNASTSFTIDGEYGAEDVTGLDTSIATVTLTANGDSVTYGELRDSTNSGTRIELASSEYTFTGSDSAYTMTLAYDGTTWYVKPSSGGHSSGSATNTITWNEDGSVYLYDGSKYLYVNRSTLAWDKTSTTSGYEVHCTFYIYGAGEDADSAIPGYTMITSDDQIVSGEGYLIAFYDAEGQLYVVDATTRTTSAYNQMAAVVTVLDNATTTVTVTGVAEGTTSMELAGTDYNITVLPENYDPISIPETAYVYQGTAVTVTEKPANGTTEGQPFASGTGGSTYFRIPGIVTLNDGTLIATTDARWNHTGDGAGLDTLVSVSTDNGANWTYTYANYLGDNGDTYNNLSTCFIDPGIGTDGTTAYMIADLWPAGIALNTSKYAPVAGENGFDDNGNLLLRDLAGDTVVIGESGYNTMAAAREYNYYLDLETYEVYTTNGTLCEGFTVDEYFNISYTDAEGTTYNTNLFFADSPFQPYPTDYLYLTTSTDGLNWSIPKLLNLQAEEEQSYLVGPGNGTYDEVRGNMVFTAYRHTGGGSGTGYECTSLIWMDASGNWYRSEDATTSGWSSEASAVVLDDGTVRVFYRDGYSVLRYTDYQWSETENNYVRDEDATEVSTIAAKKSGCQLTSIKYSETIDGKEAVIVATPANSGSRADGHVYIFLVEEDNTMTLAYDYDVTPNSTEYYAYSCITELDTGNLGLLWESNSAALTYTEIDMAEAADRENDARLNFADVTVLTGKSVAVSDSTGYYVGADTSELDTDVATVEITGTQTTANAAQVLSTGANVDLDTCLYTFTADGAYYVVSATAADGTAVYLNHYSSTSNNIPNITTAGKIAVLEPASDDLAGMFRLQAQVDESSTSGTNARTLHFHAEATTPYWNRCGSDTSYKCHEYLFRKAAEGETASTDIPGYVQLTDVSEVEDGGQYLIAAKNDAGNWYVLNPAISTTSLDHIAQYVGTTTVGTTEVTFTGVGAGYTEVLIGTTVYHVTVKQAETVEVSLSEGGTATYTIDEGNYADADTSALNTSVATVTMEGVDGANASGVNVTPSTTLTDGTYVILNTRSGKLVNNTSASAGAAAGTMAGLSLSGNTTSFEASTAVWTITAVDGGYTVQDANGKYMTIGANAGGLSDEAQVLTIAYADGTWTLMQSDAYLNDAGGAGTTASGWQNSSAATDAGSQFELYAYGDSASKASTTVTFTGVSAGTTSVTIDRFIYNITVTDTHEHVYESVVTAPTCTEGGYTTYTCACGDSYTGDETEALGHTFVDGTCTVCGAGIAYNEDTETNYTTLAEALAAAEADETVQLKGDSTEDKVLVTPSVTLDLNGHVLTADYVVGFDTAEIVDNAGGGKLIIAEKNVVLDEDNAMVPVYDGTGYIFTKAGFAIKEDESYTDEGIKIDTLVYPVNMDVVGLLKDGSADNNLQVMIVLSWDVVEEDGTVTGTGSQKFVFTDEVVEAVYSSNNGTFSGYEKRFSMIITGFESVTNLTAKILLVSGTNVEYGSSQTIAIS